MYIGKGGTHTPSTLRAILLGILNSLVKITLHKPNFHSERVDSVYPDHKNALKEAGQKSTIFRTMGEWWKGQDKKTDLDK